MDNDDMYIRFGALPDEGHSHNNETNTPEAGVSVYRAWWNDSDHDAITIEIPAEDSYVGGNASGLFDRPVYIVTGTLLTQRGGDGELLMAPGCTDEYVGPVEVVNYIIGEA